MIVVGTAELISRESAPFPDAAVSVTAQCLRLTAPLPTASRPDIQCSPAHDPLVRALRPTAHRPNAHGSPPHCLRLTVPISNACQSMTHRSGSRSLRLISPRRSDQRARFPPAGSCSLPKYRRHLGQRVADICIVDGMESANFASVRCNSCCATFLSCCRRCC